MKSREEGGLSFEDEFPHRELKGEGEEGCAGEGANDGIASRPFG